MIERFLTVNETANLFGLDAQILNQLTKQNGFPSRALLNGDGFYIESEINAWITDQIKQAGLNLELNEVISEKELVSWSGLNLDQLKLIGLKNPIKVKTLRFYKVSDVEQLFENYMEKRGGN